jgi:pyruvate carboxylase
MCSVCMRAAGLSVSSCVRVVCQDTAGTGVASMIAAAKAGADAVDAAMDAMSGTLVEK